MRPGLLRQHGAGPEDRLRRQEQLRLRRHQRHSGVRPRLSRGPLLRLELRPSRALAAALALLHVAAALCALATFPGTPGSALAALFLALGAVAAWQRALLRGRGAVRAIELGTEAAATLELADGRRLTGSVAARRHVFSLWVTLPLRGA